MRRRIFGAWSFRKEITDILDGVERHGASRAAFVFGGGDFTTEDTDSTEEDKNSPQS